MIALAAVSVAWSGPSPVPVTLIVQADVLKVRAAPSSTAAEVARLRIGTVVGETARRDGWVEVRLGSTHGWVGADFVDTEAPTVPGLLARAEAEPDPAAALRYTQRAAALDGRDRAIWEQLAAYALRAGVPAEAERARRVLAGREITWFARCRQSRADLVAVHVPGEGFRSMVADDPSKPVVSDAERLALGGLTWYESDDGAVWVQRRGHFERPVRRPLANPSTENAIEGDGAGEVVDLGTCSSAHGHEILLSTDPFLVAAPRATMDLRRTSGLLPVLSDVPTEGLLQLGLTEPIAGFPWVEARLTRSTFFPTCGEGYQDLADRVVLLDPRGAPLFSVGGEGGGPPDAGASRWYVKEVDDHSPRALLWTASSWGSGGYGATLAFVDRDGRAEAITVALAYFGC